MTRTRTNKNGGHVNLSVINTNEKIIITVENTGSRLHKEDLKENHSLVNIQKRLKLLVNGSMNFRYNEKEQKNIVELIIDEGQAFENSNR